jgi:hypothetical protein
VVTAYAPTDAREDVAKDAFYLMLFACLKGALANDKLIVLGDFNAELGNIWQEQDGVTGKFHLHRVRPSHRTVVPACLIWSHPSTFKPPTPSSSTTVRI